MNVEKRLPIGCHVALDEESQREFIRTPGRGRRTNSHTGVVTGYARPTWLSLQEPDSVYVLRDGHKDPEVWFATRWVRTDAAEQSTDGEQLE